MANKQDAASQPCKDWESRLIKPAVALRIAAQLSLLEVTEGTEDHDNMPGAAGSGKKGAKQL